MKPIRSAVGLSICVLLVSISAEADPVETRSSSSSSTRACAYWSEFNGSEYANIDVCASEQRHGDDTYRFVDATRTVGHCSDEECVDSYREQYTGPAEEAEADIDPAGGRASLDIVLDGEAPGDECLVRMEMHTESEGDDSSGIWPTFNGGLSPDYSWVSVRSGDRTVNVSSERALGMGLQVRNESSSESYGEAVGSACDWSLAAADPGLASIYSETYASDSVDVRSPDLSTELGGQRRAGAFWTASVEGGSLHVYALLRQYSGSAHVDSALQQWAEPRAVDVYVSTWLCRGEGDEQTCDYRDWRTDPGNDLAVLDPTWSSVEHESVLTDEGGASCSFRLTWDATEPAEAHPTRYGEIGPDQVNIERWGASVERHALATIASPCLPDDVSLLDGFLIQEHDVSAFARP